MFKNYILVAFRQLRRHRMFSALNIFCLAIGISFCLLIGQFVFHERAMNAGLKNYHQQYLIKSEWKVKNTGPEITSVGPLTKALKQNYPGLVSDYYRSNPVLNVVSAGDKHFREDVSIGDTSLVSMFGFPLLYGDPSHAFINSSSAVITEEFALKLFGDKNAIGKTLTFTNLSGKTTDYKVSAVLKSIPYTTVTHAITKNGYALYIPFEGNQYYSSGNNGTSGTEEENWNKYWTVSYLRLQDGIKPEQLAAPVKKLLALNAPETISKNLEVQLKPLDTYYLTSNNGAVGKTLSILTLVALGILLLAGINFVNIMIGTSSYRIKEIGLRKVFGGRRKQLIFQYLIESIVLTLVAAVLSVLFYGIFRPFFNELLHTSLQSINAFHFREFLFLGVLVLLVGIVAGMYPAFILSGSDTVSSVKGKTGSVEKGMWLRKSLLVLQFTIAIGVLIFSMTLSKQVDYFFNKDLGYNKDQLMIITAFPKQWDSAGVARMESIRNGLISSGVVKDAAVSFDIPERGSPGQFQVNPEGAKNNQLVAVQTIAVDEKYASTFGIHLSEGRFFRDKIGGFVSGEAVINESARKAFGWKNAEGRKLVFPNGGGTSIVVGVVKDFHMASLNEPIQPLVMSHVVDNIAYRFLTVKLKPGNISQSIDRVRAKWKELTPSSPFDFVFMDEKLQSMYQSELQLKKASSVATGLMLLIVLLGIFGVLTLALSKRMKEIAIRKVLGADILHILSLFIRQYAGLLLLANGIAWPLTYYLSKQWLDQYVYRIVQPTAYYFTAGISVAFIAFLLIVLQCLQAAVANPISSLKAE